MKIVSLILPLFITSVKCSWLCDLIGLDCVTQSAVVLHALVPVGGWQNIEMEYVEVASFSPVHCSTLCSMGGFTGSIYFPDSNRCYLLGMASLPTFNSVSTALFKNPDMIQLQNVALGKPTRAAQHSGSYHPSNAVDGNHDKPYASEWVVKSWWVVDLGTAYDIFNIKLVHRQNSIGLAVFHGIEVRAGNTEVTGKDFTSYDLLEAVDVAPDSFLIWFVIIPPENSPPYQFISIQIVRTSGDMYLDIGEVYVNSII